MKKSDKEHRIRDIKVARPHLKKKGLPGFYVRRALLPGRAF